MLLNILFGTIKRSLGYTYFLRKGLPSVNTEATLICLAYNFKRLKNIDSVKNIIHKMKEFFLHFCYYSLFFLSNLKKHKFFLKIYAFLLFIYIFYVIVGQSLYSCNGFSVCFHVFSSSSFLFNRYIYSIIKKLQIAIFFCNIYVFSAYLQRKHLIFLPFDCIIYM